MSHLRNFMQDKLQYLISITPYADNSLRHLVTQYCERYALFSSMPDNQIICRVLGKYLVWGDANDCGLIPHLMFQGYWEIWVTAVVARYARPGTTAIDIGANVGYYTLILADAVGAEGQVIAFEPNPRIYKMLGKSVSINGFRSRVSIRAEAVSSSCGAPLTFAIPTLEPKNAGIVFNPEDRLSFTHQFGKDVDFVNVQQISLDSLNLNNVGVVKIDAEGAEKQVWDGMIETVKNNPDIIIIMEYNCGRGYDAMALYSSISNYFDVKHIDYDGEVKPLTIDMINTQRKHEDWMLFLSRLS